MARKRTSLILATCAALAACDGSSLGDRVAAPEPGPHASAAIVADPAATLYQWDGSAVGEAVIPEAMVGAQQAATGGRASGRWRLAEPILNRAAEEYSFVALSTNPAPTAKGEIQLHTTFVGELESRVHLDVDCLVVVGNRAWFSGPARRWVLGGIEQPPGLYLVFSVQDNGEGENDPPDLGSPAFGAPPMACALQPPLPMTPTDNGNIQVRQR